MANKEKLVIIGGGVGSMSAAYALTDPEQEDKYDITVYQIGWRLGGKGASGRNADISQRIEEHGLHIWFGFYDNAFQVMRDCYDELGRNQGVPLADLDKAFAKQDYFILHDQFQGQWHSWPITFPTNTAEPGDHPDPLAFIQIIYKWLKTGTQQGKRDFTSLKVEVDDRIAREYARHKGFFGWLVYWFRKIFRIKSYSIVSILKDLDRLIDTPVEKALANLAGDVVVSLLDVVANITWFALKDDVDTDLEARRHWILMCLGITTIRGMIKCDIIDHGFDSIDDRDLREWMFENSPLWDFNDDEKGNKLAYWSAPIQTFYDAAFCYENGNVETPRIGAGIGLLAILRIAFSYKGSVVYTMCAGMGDTIFAPLYLVLKKRGVKFKFFHKIEDLQLDEAGKSIAAIKVKEQVELNVPEYDPLVTVRELPCWPNQPKWEQIINGDKLKKSGVNLEHYNSNPQPPGIDYTLVAGRDFDRVVLGVTLDCLPYIASQLIQKSPRWQAMIAHMKSTQTQAIQLWASKTAHEMGVPGDPAVLGSYVEPWSSITDFSHLLRREEWPPEMEVKFLTYSCGVLLKEDNQEQKIEDEKVKQRAIDFLNNDVKPIWPGACSSQNSDGIDWSVLIDVHGRTGADRFDAQYWRANIDPTEMYVLSLPNTMKYRMRPGENDFDNLVICGTWVDAGFNIGSVECAVMSGLHASKFISGHPKKIVGSAW